MMVMGISALTAERYSNYDAESSETADAGPFSVIKHGRGLGLEFFNPASGVRH